MTIPRDTELEILRLSDAEKLLPYLRELCYGY